MKLDHFVVHIDNDAAILNNLKTKIEPLGFPFEPSWGKGTKGFKAANIWIGRQYFEIIRLLKDDGGGWTPKWVDRYKQGKRGLFCIFLLTEDIDKTFSQLRSCGVAVSEPERVTFKALFGLLKKSLPWRMIYTPEIPGTDLEIGFIQYDPDPKDRIKQYLVPNSDENGIVGLSSAVVQIPLTSDALSYLQKLFPHGKGVSGGFRVTLIGGSLVFQNSDKTWVILKADTSNSKLRNTSFEFQNVSVTI